jgi:hypothetical protein
MFVMSRRRKRKRRSPVPALPDPRLAAAAVTGVGGVPADKGTFAFRVSPVRLDDDRVVCYQSPSVVDFYLWEAIESRDVGERKRRKAVSDLTRADDGNFRFRQPKLLLDALADLTKAVFLSTAGIEAFANIMVEDLPEDAEVKTNPKTRIARDDMVRRLNLKEKLALAVPLATGQPSVKGTHPWERFVDLVGLRNELTHVKEHGYSTNPDAPSAFGRLLRGDGSSCVDSAAGIVNACDPEWPSPRVMAALAKAR